jgi:hypothetical protein
VNFSRRFQHSLCLVVATLALTLVSGCNMFSPFSSPSGDAQLISSCRALFDNGDFQGAIQCYGQVSSDNQGIKLSDTAYAELAEQNASMPNYAAAFGKGNAPIGPAITKFAEGMIVGAGETRRIAIFNAFNNYKTLASIDTNLASIVQFIGALSFAAEILAEEGSYDQNGNPILTQSDLNAFQLTGTPNSSLTNATLSQVSGTGNYSMLNAALLDIATAATALGGQASFSSTITNFAQGISGQVATAAYIQALILANVGETGN